MKKVFVALFSVLIAVGSSTGALQASAPQPSASAAPTVQSILERMTASRKDLNSFSVAIHFDITLHEVVDVGLGLDGVQYYEQPDKEALIFNSVPVMAKDFQRLYPHIGTPQTWPVQYDISIVDASPSDARAYGLKLVPKRPGNVDHVLLDVDKGTFAPTRSVWIYRNGASIDMDILNKLVTTKYTLPSIETVDISFPQYKAHAVAHFGDYTINRAIPESVWKNGS